MFSFPQASPTKPCAHLSPPPFVRRNNNKNKINYYYSNKNSLHIIKANEMHNFSNLFW
jgi:hypothetical protein